MKCLSEELIMAFVEGECTAEEKAQINKHIQSCIHCKKLYEDSKHEFRMLTQLAKYEPLPEILDESFVASVREKIRESLRPALSARYVQSNSGGKKMKKVIAATAAGLVVITAAGAIASPTFADYLGFSYVKDLGRFLGITEKNVKDAFNKQGIEVTDNGITLRIEDILADTNRVLVSYKLLDENGKVIDPQDINPNSDPVPIIQEWKKKGKKITEEELKLLETTRVFLADEKGKLIVQHPRWDREKEKIGSYVFDNLPNNMPNQIYFKLEARQIGKVKGNWKLSVPIDLTKAKKAMNAYKINKKYISPHGVEVGVKQVVYTPTMTKLTLSKDLVQSERERIEKQYAGHLFAKFRLLETNIHYRIVDEHHRLIAQSYAPGSDAKEKPKVKSLGTNGKISGEYVAHYQPFPETKQLTFILDSVVRYEPTDFVLAFAPDRLPIKLQADGSTFVIKSFKLKKEKYIGKYWAEKEKTVAEIVIDERYQDKAKLEDQFFIQDETGKTYEMNRGGWRDGVRDGLERNQRISTIEINMDQIPKKLMIRPIIVKEYKDVNFQVPIPPYHPNER